MRKSRSASASLGPSRRRVPTTAVGLMALGLGLAAGGAAALAAEAPVAVSPGDTSKLALIADPCPTFSWGEVEGARSYEIVVYRLGAEDEEAQPVLEKEIAGSAESWTPSLESCLERGGQYAWSVRAAGLTEVSGWSSPILFEVALGPSEALVEATVEAVREYLASRGRRDVAGAGAVPASVDSEETRSERLASSPGAATVGATQLTIDGGVEATSFTGDGSTLTNLAPSNLSVAVPVEKGGTGATTAAGARTALAAAAETDLTSHAANVSAHHTETVDTTCHGAACDGTSFANVTAVDLGCSSCVSTAELGFDPGTQAELNSHAGQANAHHAPPDSLPPSGSAGGDLVGTYPNPGVINDSHTHGNGTVSDLLSIDNGRLWAPAGAGKVGIGTTAPVSKLDVVGDARVSGQYRFSAARTFYRWVPASAFRSVGDNIGDWIFYAGNLGVSFAATYWHPVDDEAEVIVAPVQLPGSSKVTDVDCYYYDTHSSYDIETIWVFWQRRGVATTSATLLAENSVGPFPGLDDSDGTPKVVSIGGLSTNIVNQSNAYSLRVLLDLVTGGATTFAISFYGCRVTFTLENVFF